jgi:hypothetical protein
MQCPAVFLTGETAIHCVSAYDDICWTLCFDSLGTQCPAVFMQCFAMFFDWRDGDSSRLGV